MMKYHHARSVTNVKTTATKTYIQMYVDTVAPLGSQSKKTMEKKV